MFLLELLHGRCRRVAAYELYVRIVLRCETWNNVCVAQIRIISWTISFFPWSRQGRRIETWWYHILTDSFLCDLLPNSADALPWEFLFGNNINYPFFLSSKCVSVNQLLDFSDNWNTIHNKHDFFWTQKIF